MNELELLEAMRSDSGIDTAALQRARRRMLRHALAPAARRRGFGVRRHTPILAGAAMTVAAIAGVVAALLVLPGPQGAEPAAAAVLERAAHVTASQPTVRPGQYLHVRTVTTRWYDGEAEETVQEHWVPGNEDDHVVFRDFEGHVYLSRMDPPPVYADVDLTTQQVLEWLRRDNGDLRGDEAAVERAGETFFDATAPADFKARVFEALAEIDGVEVVDGETTFRGSDAVVLGHTGVFSQQFVFDEEAGTLLGVRTVGPDGEPSVDGTYSTYFQETVVQGLPPRATTG